MDAIAHIVACCGDRLCRLSGHLNKWAFFSPQEVDKGTFITRHQICPEQGSAEAN